MKIVRSIKKARWVVLLLLIAVVIANCIEIRGLTQPASANAGETITISVQAWFDPYFDQPSSRMIIGFLAPTSWNARENTVMTYTSNIGNGTMSPVSATAKPVGESQAWAQVIENKIGIGGNYIKDVEWVVFQSDIAYDMSDLPEINAVVTIKTKVGPENLRVKLGYFSASTQQDLNDPKYYGKWFSDCFEVMNGTGVLRDFCSPQIQTIVPSQTTDNDIITITYDEDAIATALSGADQVLLCARAFTTAGDSIEVCSQEMKAQLSPIGGKKWRLDMWPRRYFQLTDDQTLDRMEFYFTDKTGTIKVFTDGDTGDVFVFPFVCQ